VDIGNQTISSTLHVSVVAIPLLTMSQILSAVFFALVGGADAVQSRTAPIDLINTGAEVKSELEQELEQHDQYVAEVWERLKRETPPWKSVRPQDIDQKSRNICVDGKQIPDFYVLGVQKCATSSLADNLMLAGMTNVHGDLNPKEFHWFDHRMDYLLEGASGAEKNKEEWLSWMPDCPQAGSGGNVRRNVLADFTPDYFRIVPRPQDFTPSDRYWMKVQEEDVMGPVKVKEMYGENAKKLQFAVMFREPLAQMQSAWYHAQSFNFTNACKSCVGSSFKAVLEQNLKGLNEKPRVLTPWIWTALYARQLEPWLEHFDASQFYMIPMHQLTSEKKDNICKDIGDRLQFKVDCESQGVESLHAWSHEHPPVDEDAGYLRRLFNKFIAAENAKLVKMLTKAHALGMGLANYDGPVNDEDEVQAWLESSW